MIEGGDGAVGIGFSCFGHLFNDIYDHCRKGNYQEARKLQNLEREIYELVYKVSLNPTFKYLTEKATGLTLGPIRWPQ